MDKAPVYDDSIESDRCVDTVNSFMAEEEEGFVSLHINKTHIELKVTLLCNDTNNFKSISTNVEQEKLMVETKD